jgi:hypothetical protein
MKASASDLSGFNSRHKTAHGIFHTSENIQWQGEN